ncbi:50S ribosome-binding GTPase [Candidatus Woesearchaeota archaeon]|nr:50S ribosome-binding GTPase [Candidatus Woesearchaeota archaeon]
MKKSFWDIVNKIIHDSNVVLEVLDARFPEETRNREIEQKVRAQGKKVIYVLNKCDLVPKQFLEEAKSKLKPCVFVSSKNHQGTLILRKLILKIGDREKIKVGVLGYPKTGKSSLINALKGKKSAKTSPISGFTKAMQWVRIDNRIMLIDSPGVIPFREKMPLKHVLISTTDYSSVEDPDAAAMDLIAAFPGQFEAYYGVKPHKDPQDTLEEIALKNNKLKKGGVPDVDTMARIIIKDWQQGKIRKAR